MYDLDCRYCCTKSFYGKAKVLEHSGNGLTQYLLYSYNTLVAIYSKDENNNLKIYDYVGHFSLTTTRHQDEFFRQKGLSEDEIKQIKKVKHLELPYE